MPFDADAFRKSLDGINGQPPDREPTGRIDLDAFRGSLSSSRSAGVANSLESVTGNNPDSRARAEIIGQERSLPTEMVESSLPEFERRQTLQRNTELLSGNPVAGEFISDPDNAAVAHDDVENLTSLEQLVKKFNAENPTNLERLIEGFNNPDEGMLDQLRRTFNLPDLARAPAGELISTPGRMIRGIAELNDAFGRKIQDVIRAGGADAIADILDTEIPWWVSPSGILREPGGVIVEAGEAIGVPPERQNIATDITGGLGQLTSQIAIGLVLGPAGQIAGLAGQGADILSQDAAQSGSTREEADAAVVSGAAVTALTEKLGLDILLNRVPPAIKNNVLRFIADKVITGGIEAGQEVVEGIFHNLTARLTFDPDRDLTGGLSREAIAAGGAGALFRTLLGVGRGGAGLLQDRRRAADAEAVQQAFVAMGENAKASKVRERLPERYRQFVESVLAQGPVNTVYVDTEALVTLMQDGFDGGDLDLESLVSEARDAGQPVEIPLADYQTVIAGTEAGQALLGDVKFRADDFTANEAQNFNFDEEFKAEVQAQIEIDRAAQVAQAPSDQVFENIKTQLLNAGETPDHAQQQAALHGAFAKVLQERYGVDPQTVYGDLTIKGPLPDSLRSPIDSLDLLIEGARRGAVESDLRLFGESLQEMARRLGVRDDRGDLASQDIDKDLKPFQRKMLRDDGVQLDDLLTAAIEDGFFPGIEQLDINDLIQALTGPPVFSELRGDPRAAARTQAINDLIEVLSRLNISLESTNEEIKAALGAAESSSTLDQFFQGGAVTETERILNQGEDSLDGRVKGNIQFFGDTAKTIINLGRRADLSTFLHESGHLFVRVLGKVAETNEDAAADLGVMLKFAGVESVEAFQKTGPQEKLARAFEAYLREGHAPSVELQGAFSRFRSWLIQVYKTLTKLNVELDDEIRGVFDRLLATDAEITESEQVNDFIPKNAIQELMSDKEKAAYIRASQVATDQAVFQLEKQKIAEQTREETERWKEEFETVSEEIAGQVDAQPVYQAIGAIRDKSNALFLSRDATEDIVGKEGLRNLPGGLTRVKDGVNPDFAAEQFGFSSGDEMLFAMMNAAKNKAERGELVKSLAEEEMKRRHGSLLENQAQAAEAASEIVHSDERGKFLAMELRALARKTDNQVTPSSVAKAAAKRIIAQKKTKDAIQVGRYAAAEVRAGKAATKALLEGDIQKALEAKRQQILSHYLFMESLAAKEELNAILRYFGKFRKKSKTLDAGYAEQIDGLLEKYDFRRSVSLKAIERRKSLAAFVAEQNDANQPVSISDSLLSDAQRQHYKDTPLEEIRGLRDAVKHLEKLGRLKNRLLTEGAKRDLNDTVKGMADSIRENWAGKIRQRTLSLTPLEKTKERILSKASLRRMEFTLRELDGFKPGPMQEILFGMVADADDNLQERRVAAGRVVKDLFSPFKWRDVKRFFTRKTFIPEINDSLTHESVLSVALNVGNSDNKAKMLKGNNWTDEGLNAVLAKMSKKDWDLVQGIWDYVDTFWDETVQLNKETTGKSPPKIQAERVETPFGDYRGGYYPIKYSTRDSDRSLRHNTEDIYKRMLMGDIGRPTTNQGRNIERVAPTQGLSIRLDLSVFFEHIDETMHDLAFRKAATDASKIINHPDLVNAIKDTLGEPQVNILRTWLKDTVAGDISSVTSVFDSVFAHVRKRATVAAMGFKLSTALIQPMGYTQTVARFIEDAGKAAGLKYSLKGIRDYYQAPRQMTKFVFERSSFMRTRAHTWDRDVHDAVKSLKKGPLAYFESSFFWHIAKMQIAVDMPTWIGAYEWSLDAQPEKGEVAASKYADSVVRMTQGAGAAKDLAPIQRGSEGGRTFTMFMTYFSAMNGMIIDNAKQLIRNPTPGQIATFSTNMFLLTIVPGTLVPLIYHAAGVDGPEDDESYGGWLFKDWVLQATGGIPILRDFLSHVVGGFPYEVSPAAQLVKRAAGFPKQVEQGEADQALFGAALSVAALGPVPIPVGQIRITSNYFADLITGEEEGFNPVEAFVKADHRD